MEIWKDIKNFEGLYEVSNSGRVKSIPRVDRMNREVEEKIRKAKINKNG